MADDLFDAGVEDERQKLLAKQLAAAQALRGTAMPRGRDTGKMYVAANPMEMLGATIDRTTGRQREADLMGQQQALVEGKEQSRRQLGGEIQALPPLPVPEMLSTDEDIQKAQQSMGAHLGVANKALASADPGLKALGQQIRGDVKNVYAGLVKSREKLAAARELEAPEVKAALRMTLAKLNGTTPDKIPQNWSGRALKMAVDSMQKPYAADAGLEGRKYGAEKGLEARLAALEASKEKASAKDEQTDDKMWERYVNKTNPGLQTSRSVLGSDKNTMQRVDRTLALIGAKPYQTPEEMADINVALAGVLSGGNVAARRTIDEISYKTFNMKAAEAMQWLTNKPQDAKAQEFVKRIKDTLIAERDAAKQRVIDTVTNHATGMQDLLKKKGKVAIDYHRKLGVPDETLRNLDLDVGEAAVPSGPPTVNDEASYNALPAGAEYIHGPTGQKRKKKG